jgi:hypothetical protein
MTFCRFFGMGGEVHPSRLGESDFMKILHNRPESQPPTLAAIAPTKTHVEGGALSSSPEASRSQ